MAAFFTRYFRKNILVILLLGFSSGLPLALVGSTLAARLSDGDIAMSSLGLFAYVASPYTFKFAWAPLIDHLRIPVLGKLLGQRVSWMLMAQVGVMGSVIALGMTDPKVALFPVAILALVTAFFSASQDVVIDAYRAEYLTKEDYGEGAAVAVFGYRVGMLAAGAGALALADQIDWSLVYTIMGGLLIVGMLTVLWAGEPKVEKHPIRYHGMEDWLKQAVLTPFVQFAKHHPDWILILVFVALYRMSDGFIGFMSTPFFLDMGFSKTEIAAVAKLFGFCATIVGAMLGAAGIRYLGLWKALFAFGILQLTTNLSYLLVASVGHEVWALTLAISLDNLSGGAVTAAAIAFLMRLCHPDYTATQYALLSSLASLAGMTLAGAAGFVAEHFGWPVMFMTAGILGLPALALLYMLRKQAEFAPAAGQAGGAQA